MATFTLFNLIMFRIFMSFIFFTIPLSYHVSDEFELLRPYRRYNFYARIECIFIMLILLNCIFTVLSTSRTYVFCFFNLFSYCILIWLNFWNIRFQDGYSAHFSPFFSFLLRITKKVSKLYYYILLINISSII